MSTGVPSQATHQNTKMAGVAKKLWRQQARRARKQVPVTSTTAGKTSSKMFGTAFSRLPNHVAAKVGGLYSRMYITGA